MRNRQWVLVPPQAHNSAEQQTSPPRQAQTPAIAGVEVNANASIWWLFPVLLLATLAAYSPP